MPNIEVNIELYCATCGAGLCSNATATEKRGQPCFQVEACDRCVLRASDKGFEEGHEKGYEEAREKYESEAVN